MNKDISLPQQPDNNYIQNIPDDLLRIIFGFFSPHEQLCQLSRVSAGFRSVAYDLLKCVPAFESLETKSKAFNLPSYSRHQFFHAGRLCAAELDSFLESNWSVAAFMGDQDTVEEILGENYSTHKDEVGRTVAHYAAYGGQLPFLKKLVKKFGEDVIKMKDIDAYSCIHFAAMRQHISTLEWLVNEQGFSFFDKTILGGFDALDYIETRASQRPNSRHLNHHVLLLLAPLLRDRSTDCSKSTPENLKALNQKLCLMAQRPPEFLDGEEHLQNQSFDDLIVSTMHHIVNKKREYLPFLNELIHYKHRTMYGRLVEPPKFLF